MAVATEVQTVTITVNDVEIQVPKGEMIVESVKRLGIDIPIFCYHPRLKPVGMCRMCLVEVATKGPDGTVRRMPKPQTACSLPASDGLIIWTESEAIHRDRKGVLESRRRVSVAEQHPVLRSQHQPLRGNEAARAQGVPAEQVRDAGLGALYPVRSLRAIYGRDFR